MGLLCKMRLYNLSMATNGYESERDKKKRDNDTNEIYNRERERVEGRNDKIREWCGEVYQ